MNNNIKKIDSGYYINSVLKNQECFMACPDCQKKDNNVYIQDKFLDVEGIYLDLITKTEKFIHCSICKQVYFFIKEEQYTAHNWNDSYNYNTYIRQKDLLEFKNLIMGIDSQEYLNLQGVPKPIAHSYSKAYRYKNDDPETAFIYIRRTFDLLIRDNLQEEIRGLEKQLKSIANNDILFKEVFDLLNQLREDGNEVIHETPKEYTLSKIHQYIKAIYALLQIKYVSLAVLKSIQHQIIYITSSLKEEEKILENNSSVDQQENIVDEDDDIPF